MTGVDTANKRRSTLGPLPWSLPPVPDASLANAADRRQVGWVYRLFPVEGMWFGALAQTGPRFGALTLGSE